MIILSIETSCDETAISLVEATGELPSPSFNVLGNALFSQIDIHKEFGGVFPMLAKREHAKNLPVLLKKVLEESREYKLGETRFSESVWQEIKEITNREIGLYEGMRETLEDIVAPRIDVISVTSGPGLAPALWVGISFAKALGKLWNVPVIPANHMEGHIASILIENSDKRDFEFPALALLISGGHTELVYIEGWGKYEVIGSTRDDAVGEAFDKTARLLNLPYPGGPEISKLAEKARTENYPHIAKFPRPMMHSSNLDFSFAGLKTAVLYYMRDHFSEALPTEEERADIAREFEDTVVEVLLFKTEKALLETKAKTLIIAGGVIANKKIRDTFSALENKYQELKVKTPAKLLSTDNSLMIASASYINILLYPEILKTPINIIANGNLKLGTNSL
jgi:N6-L-threonylcarbamoyladenine synthase